MDIDPNDLLSTNVFINEPILEDIVSDEENDDFKKYYLSKKEKNAERDVQTKLDIRTAKINENEAIQLSDISSVNDLLISNKFTGESNSNKGANVDSFSINSGTTGPAAIRVKKDIKTLISIDSRDRDKVKFPLPSHFDIFLGKTFYNIREVRLVSIEFPNTNAVINNNNNLIYWIDKEDIDLDVIDNITNTYPVYKTTLRTGSYVLSSLQSEMTDAMRLIKRSNPSKPFYHYFVINLDIDTDVVTFISLILTQLKVNPLTTIINTGIITVSATSHGFSTGDEVYILGATIIAGIPSATLNGFHKITVINSNTFQYEVNVNASESLIGGGNTVQTGTSAPFQFLFGEYSNTIAPNIGYPIENSSTLINTYISSIDNYHMLKIVCKNTPFTTSYDYIGNNIILNNSGGYLDNNGSIGNSIDGVHLISNVINSTTILVTVSANLYETVYVTQTDNNNGTGDIVSKPTFLAGNILFTVSNTSTTLVLPNGLLQPTDNYYKGWWIKIISGNSINNVREITSYISGTNSITVSAFFLSDLEINDVFYLYSAPTLTLNSTVYTISSIQNYDVETVLFTFFTPHNYTLSDIGSNISFYNTTSNPTFDGENVILGVPDTTSLYISGSILTGGSASTATPGVIGYTPSYNLLTTKTLNIANVTIGYPTLITTTTAHELSVGDKFLVNGLIVTPMLSGVFTVYTIPSPTTFTLNFTSTNLDTQSIANAYIGTDLITISFPDHGFNKIILMQNGPTTNTVDIHTLLPHKLSNGELIRIMETGISYIDNTAYIITYLTVDSFRITVTLPVGYIVNSTTGILGMSNTFRLYNCPTLGGITPSFFNNVLFTVHDIIDTNTFTFHIYNSYATSTVTGGSSIYISSFKHGFQATQKNTKNNILNRSINLEGENYAFLCCPQLSTMLNTGSVKNIFARITLDQSPGMVVFNFLSNPKRFETVPLQYLHTLSLSILNYDASYYVFNDLDYSFTLEITEVVDTTDNFNISSKRGITDISKQY